MCQFLCFLVGISYWTNCKPTSCWFSSSSPLGSLFSRWKLRSLFSLKHHRQDVAIIQTSPERPGKGGSNCWCPGGRECDPNFNRSPLEICGFYNLFWGCISLINIYLNLDTVYVFIFRCSICIYIYTYVMYHPICLLLRNYFSFGKHSITPSSTCFVFLGKILSKWPCDQKHETKQRNYCKL